MTSVVFTASDLGTHTSSADNKKSKHLRTKVLQKAEPAFFRLVCCICSFLSLYGKDSALTYYLAIGLNIRGMIKSYIYINHIHRSQRLRDRALPTKASVHGELQCEPPQSSSMNSKVFSVILNTFITFPNT